MYTTTNPLPPVKIRIPGAIIPTVIPNTPTIIVPQPLIINIDSPLLMKQPIIPVITPPTIILTQIPPLLVDLLVLHQLRLIISYNRFQYKWNRLKRKLLHQAYTLQIYEHYGIPTRYIVMLGLHDMSITLKILNIDLKDLGILIFMNFNEI